MRFKSGDKEFEFEGENVEILELYDEIVKRLEGVVAPKPVEPVRIPAKRGIEFFKLPSDDDLISFILSKPKYSHDIVEVQEHFFGKRIPSRANPRLYRKLAQQLFRVRKIIEEKEQGRFQTITSPSRNLKRYVFEPLTALDKLLQK